MKIVGFKKVYNTYWSYRSFEFELQDKSLQGKIT